MQDIKVTLTSQPKQKPADESSLGFGKLFTDHMLVIKYTSKLGWHDAQIKPYGNFEMDPASMVFHYGQAIFEGTKAYQCADGSVNLFRPEANMARMSKSAIRMCMPALDEGLSLEGIKQLVNIEKAWLPQKDGTSLYLRPTLIATDAMLGVHASDSDLFFVIISPVGAYYATGLAPVSIYVEDEYVRAVRGGVGFAKTAGNYAASIMAGEQAGKKGFAQVLWLDGVERKYIEEVGTMNVFFKIDGKIVTPSLQGSILPGVTRDSVIQVAKDWGMEVEERKISVDELYQAHADGKLEEAFGSGTAAVISPIGEFNWAGKSITIAGGEIGPFAQKLYDEITGIQYGTVADRFGWIVEV